MEMYAEVKIIKLEWLSEEANEAIVTFELDSRIYQAFGFPVSFEVGKKYKVELDFLEGIDNISWDIMFGKNENETKELILKPNSSWSYFAYGKII